MKKVSMLKLIALMVMFFSTLPLVRATGIDIQDFPIRPGGSNNATVNIDLPQGEQMFEYKGVQFDMVLPEDITVDLTQTALLNPLAGFSVAYESYDGGKSCRVITYTQGTAITATEGLMTLVFQAAPGAAPGPRTLQIEKVVFSSPKGLDIDGTDSTTIITVVPEEEEFNAYLYIEDFEINRGATFTAPVSVVVEAGDMITFTGFQFDIQLPQGVTVAAANLSSELGGASVIFEPQGNGIYRFVSTRRGSSTNLMDIVFQAADDATAGTYAVPVTDVIFSDTKSQDVFLDDSSFDITIKVTEVVIPVESITLNVDDVTINVGDSFQLVATVLPENATDQTIVWSSADESIATVSQDGTVTGVKEGVVEVTATCGGVSATCQVTVVAPKPGDVYVTSIEVDPSVLVMMVDDEPYQLTAIVLPENATNKNVQWSSSNPMVATVSSTGVVTPVAVGQCTVTALAMDGSGKSGTCLVTVKEEEGPVGPEIPTVPAEPIPDGWHGNPTTPNGTYVSALKIREGNDLGMGVNLPTGGYEDAWTYLWTAPDKSELGNEREIWTSAELYGAAAQTGNEQSISSNVYNVTLTNFDGSEIFWEATLPTATVQVYKRPQAPAQLLRKGQHPTGGQTPETGTSCTFVVMMTPLDNSQILDLGYSYTYGYTDPNGMMYEIGTTDLRYIHTTSDIYNDPALTFWAYSQWTYADGSIITSGLRYLDGSEDPDFDASVIDGTRASKVQKLEAAEEGPCGIYSLDGRYLGEDASRLAPGLYIINGKKVVK